MATRSYIGRENADGTITAIYCHWDGYPEHHGPILLNHYNTPEKVDSLIALGNLAILAESTEKPDGHSFNSAIDGYCVAYGRDRGEKDQEWTSFSNRLTYHSDMVDYMYLFTKEGEWKIKGRGNKQFNHLV